MSRGSYDPLSIMIPQLTTGEINRRVTMLNDKLRKEGLCAIDMAPDGNCFYRALSYATSGNQSDHIRVRHRIADLINERGNIMSGLVGSDIKGFQKYVSSLHTPGDYLYIGEDTAIAAVVIFKREIHVYSAMLNTLIYHPQCNAVDQPIKIAFFEPAHYKALTTSERIHHGENFNISSQKRVKKQ